jgi:hypothetical protein
LYVSLTPFINLDSEPCALNPTFAISRARAALTARSDNPTYLANLEPIVEGLRKAGVPEQ